MRFLYGPDNTRSPSRLQTNGAPVELGVDSQSLRWEQRRLAYSLEAFHFAITGSLPRKATRLTGDFRMAFGVVKIAENTAETRLPEEDRETQEE